MPLPQRASSTYRMYGIHREELHLMEYKVPDGSEESHHYRNNGTIIGLLIISKREVACLLSGPCFDEGGGNFTSGNGRWIVYSQW